MNKLTKIAKITTINGQITANGQTRIMILRAGKKGTGKILKKIEYWPWQSSSKDEATAYLQEYAENHDLTITKIFNREY